MKKYIRHLNAFLKPYEAIKNRNVIQYWVDNETYYFLDYTTFPWIYGFNNRNDRSEIKQFNNIQFAKRSVALYLKGVLFDDRLDKLDYNYNFSSWGEVKTLIKKNRLQDYYSVNTFVPNKINLIVQDKTHFLYLTTSDNQKILLNTDSEYILEDFYEAVVDLYIRILDCNEYQKIFNDDVTWKEFYKIYGYKK